jgi:hypothetical protein
MARHSFTVTQLLIATFWLACAAGTFTTTDTIWKFYHEVPKVVLLAMIFFGIPSFIGLAAGTLFGYGTGCVVALVAIAFGVVVLILGGLNPVEMVFFGSFAAILIWCWIKGPRS